MRQKWVWTNWIWIWICKARNIEWQKKMKIILNKNAKNVWNHAKIAIKNVYNDVDIQLLRINIFLFRFIVKYVDEKSIHIVNVHVKQRELFYVNQHKICWKRKFYIAKKFRRFSKSLSINSTNFDLLLIKQMFHCEFVSNFVTNNNRKRFIIHDIRFIEFFSKFIM